MERTNEQRIQHAYYESIKLAAHYLDASFKTLGFTAEQRKYFCEHPEAFRYGDTPSECKPEFTRYTRSGFDHGVFHSLYATLEEVRERRAQLAKVRDTNIFSQAKLNSELCVRSIIAANFPKLKLDQVHAKKLVDEHIEKKVSSYFGTSYNVNVSVSWARTIGDKDIAIVNDGKLIHLVLHAKERKLERLNSEGIKAYKCVSMTGNNGDPKLYDTWVMRWANDTTSIVALSTEFSKTESLLRRRIKKAVTDVLLDF
jgi:hypothetical protein